MDILSLLILKMSLFDLTNYLLVAERRLKYNEAPLNPQLVWDAQVLSKAIRIKIRLLQHSN